MSNFLADGTSVLPSVKTDARGPTGASDEWASADANQIRQALIDLRSYIINTWPSASAPSVTGDVGGNTALLSLILALEQVGVITNGTPEQAYRESMTPSDSYYVSVE